MPIDKRIIEELNVWISHYKGIIYKIDVEDTGTMDYFTAKLAGLELALTIIDGPRA